MPNIADVMLNKRLDELAALERMLQGDLDGAYPGWVEMHERRRDHLRGLCLRGLARCYPAKTPGEIDEMLAVAVWINR